MLYRVLSGGLLALALALFAGAWAPAQQPGQAGADKAQGNTHGGTVVSARGDKLVMKGQALPGQPAREHIHLLAPGAKVTCDGKACKLDDLKAGQKVRVTTKAGDQTVATRVEALDKQRAFGAGNRGR
jgi:hypothetical protein